MLISRAFPSAYIKAEDLQDRQHTMVMDHVAIEELGDDTKPVLYFQGAKKGLALNVTNAKTIASIYGDETDDWTGKELIIFPATTDFRGKETPCIRVKAPPARTPARDIPLPPAVIAQRGNGHPPRPAPTIRADLNDEVPF